MIFMELFQDIVRESVPLRSLAVVLVLQKLGVPSKQPRKHRSAPG